MNAAATMHDAEWLVREPKSVVFDLPDPDYSDDAERTIRRSVVSAERAEEIDPNDVLATFPLDPEEPFELRVPHTILARAAQLTARLPRVPPPAPRALERTFPRLVATVLGVCIGPVCIGIAVAGAMAYGTAPATTTPAVHKAASAAKTVVAPPVVAGAIVPTVTFDSLPRAHALR